MRSFIVLSFVLLTACEQRSPNIALGTLERDRIAHTATINEVVVALPVAQGSLVKKGTLIVQLDDTLQKAMVSQSTAEVAKFEANLDKLRNGARIEDVAAARAKEAALVESETDMLRRYL